MDDTSSGNLSADSPIKELAADSLGYRPFAEKIATILDNATTREDCLVLGIHGEWGSGKTSAINLIINYLEDRQENLPQKVNFLKILSPFYSFIPDWMPKHIKQRTTIIHFSPWLFSNQENLTTAFFHELEKQLDNTWGNIKGFLKVIAALTLPSLEALSYLNPTTSKLVGNTTQHLVKNLQKRPSLEQAKQALNKALKAQKRPILIIIDDIDRLPADEMRQIFRMVKSVADLPYVTYLLGFDSKIVERALEKDTDLEGPEWIEKIVQGSFDLPIILQSRLTKYFDKQLKNKLPDLYDRFHYDPMIEDFFNPFFENLIYPYLTTPRQVNRLINSLILQWMAVKDIVNPFDLVFIETCRLFQKNLYNFIKSNPKTLCDSTFNDFDSIIKIAPNISTLLFRKCFFTSSTDQLMNLWLNNKTINRIFSNKAFNNYFLYNQNPACYPSKEFQTINSFLDDNDLQSIITIINQNLSKTLENGDLKNLALIEEWNEFAYHDDKSLKNILIIIATVFNTLNKQYKGKGKNIIRETFINMFDQISSDKDQDDILLKAYQQHPFSSLLIHFIIHCESVQLVNSTMTNIISTYLSNNTDLCNKIKKIYKEQITKLEKDKGLEAISSDLILLITASTEKPFGQYSGDWIKEKIKNNTNNALCIMKNLIHTSEVVSNYKEEIIQINNIDEKIKKNIDLSSLIDVAQNITTTNDSQNKKTAQNFLDAYNRKPNSFI